MRRSLSPLLAALVFAAVTQVAAAPSSPRSDDPCADISERALTTRFVPPGEVLACLKSFPFQEELRQNVLTNIARVFDFFTFEEYYLDSPPPFQESTIDIRAEINRINQTIYATDYDFNKDVYDFTTQLNDGHTRWFPNCYTTWQNILPAPIVPLEVDGVVSIYIVPDLVELLNGAGTSFTDYFSSIGFVWQPLAGAKVISIEGQDPWDYVDFVARTVSGNYLDHNVRVNSVFSSYGLAGSDYWQRLGDLANPTGVAQEFLQMEVLLAGSTTPQVVNIPFLAQFSGIGFGDSETYWENNCQVHPGMNGQDLRNPSLVAPPVKQPKGEIIDLSASNAIGLPNQFIPNLEPLTSGGVIQAYVLPDGKTGVLFVGSFSADFSQFQGQVVAAVNTFKILGVEQVLIDLTNNGGGFVCLGQFLHQYFAGSQFGYPGFISSIRANPLAKKIVAADIEIGWLGGSLFYPPSNWNDLNDNRFQFDFNYIDPSLPFTVNGQSDPTSQRFHDVCGASFSAPIPEEPPFDLSKVAIVSNANCASTCAMFSTLMHERHGTKIAIFGGNPNQPIEFKGMAGNQVLEWSDLATEIKSAGLADDPLTPPDLLVSGNFRHNWRTAWSWLDEDTPIAYKSEPAQIRFPYTTATYNNPQNLWTFAAEQLFD
ncbi:hypothetical protein AX16_004834 [Volvariella volvacea WC 439]|nr:hypothetical protein AX16_004834 [Volvariella volvacea WC 439]